MLKTYFRLLSYARPIAKYAVPYILCTLLAVFFGTLNLALLSPLFTTLLAANNGHNEVMDLQGFDILSTFRAFVHNSIAAHGPVETLKYVCMVIVASVMLSNIFRYLSQRVMENLRIHTLLNLRRAVFDNLMRLEVGYFNQERKGDIMSKVSSDVQVVQYSVTNTLQVIFKEPLQLIFYVVMLVNISAKLTLFALLVIPISAFIISRLVKKLKAQATESHVSFARMTGLLDEALGGIKIIKAFNASGRVRRRFDDENIHYSKINRRMVRRQQLGSPVSEFLSVSMIAAIVYYGGTLILRRDANAMSAADFIAYIAIFSQVMRPAKALSDSFTGIFSGITAGERVLEIIDTKPKIYDVPGAAAAPEFSDRISLRNVSFAYREAKVLQDINLDIMKGKTVALVGESGGGKSTMMDLLPRFYDPVEGELLYDGMPYKGLQLESLRAQMGIVTQDSMLFNDSIFNNIAFGKPNATLQEVEHAAKIANAHNFIMAAEDGYESNVGDRGTKLSGGQRQRICIARAVLANPAILLLDEATSALDTESEKLVQQAINNLMQGRTCVVIAHRLSTIQHADLIVVLDKGRIAERGTHHELLEMNGLYHKLVRMQAFAE